MKRVKPDVPLPGAEDTCIVYGLSDEAGVFASRMAGEIKREVAFRRSNIISDLGYSYIYFVGDGLVTPLEVGGTFIQVPLKTAQGFSLSQERLSGLDWQATRDIERQLLAMHEAGIWQLPDDVRQRMLDREQMRIDVDREIQESSSS